MSFEPRQLVIPQYPVSAHSAVLPSAIMTLGLHISISRLSSSIPSMTTGRTCFPLYSTCCKEMSDFRCAKNRPISFPGGRTRTTFVTKQSDRKIPASSSIRSISRPLWPTKGTPVRDSSSPGASPTIMMRAGQGPLGLQIMVLAQSQELPRRCEPTPG